MNRIGIFWIYEKQIFCEFQQLQTLKPINGFIDSDLAHYQIWEKVKTQHPKFYLYEYEEIPRGRVVYDLSADQFIVYCNEDLLKDGTSKKLIMKAFGLSGEKTVFKEDGHYKIL